MAIIMIVSAIPMTAFAADYTITSGEAIYVTVPENGYAYCEFTPDKDGKYVVYSEYYTEHTDPIISIIDIYGNKIAEEDNYVYFEDNNFYCVFDAKAGIKYQLKLGEHEGQKTKYEITLVNYGIIEHQPTAYEPYVEITKGSYAFFKWYKTNKIFDITDKNASPCEGVKDSGNYSTYDSANGWTGVYSGKEKDGYKKYNLFDFEFEAGQTIQITIDCYTYATLLECECGQVGLARIDVDKNEPDPYTFTHSCKYTFSVYCQEVPHAKAELIEFTPLYDETDTELNTSEPGRYCCKVIFDGCRIKYSEFFEINASTPVSKMIKNADIKIRDSVTGIDVNDYGHYIEILTDHLQFEDNYGDPAVYVYDENGERYFGNFEGGKTYQITVFLSPDPGYKLSNSIVGTVNDIEVGCFIDSWEPEGQQGKVVDFVGIEFELTTANPCTHACHTGGFMGFLWSIVNFFNRIFGLNPFCVCGAAHY